MKGAGARGVRLGARLALLLLAASLASQTYQPTFQQVPIAWGQTGPKVPYSLGNWTYIPSLLLPTYVKEGQISIGANWTYTFTLKEELKYHIYLLGGWINEVEKNRTDYDVLVVDPKGSYESSHTEAAGLPEHLGSTVDDPLYKPTQTGNYSYLILNDPKDSDGTRNATFMVIEHLDTNLWHENKLYLQGREYGEPKTPTAWAYEFNSSSPRIEIKVAVPDTLDMYEARLYLMSNPAIGKGSYLSGMPIPWEPGLYGRTYYDTKYKHTIGGYNLNTTGYRGNALASCEYPGQDMLINYTSPYVGNLLYHLVLIAEYGQGNLSFIIKTDFSKPSFRLQPLGTIVEAGQDVAIQAVVDRSNIAIDSLTLEYSLDNGQVWNSIPMSVQGSSTYLGVIPSQSEGTSVIYKVTAYDKAGNKASQQGSYRTWKRSNLSILSSTESIDGGENITVSGQLEPSFQGLTLSVNYTSPQGIVVTRTVATNSTGGFRDTFTPSKAGAWIVRAGWRGNELYLSTMKNASFFVRRLPVSATFEVDKLETALGDNIVARGVTTPLLRNATFKLILIDANKQKTTLQTKTGQDGSFTASYTPAQTGQLTIQATYDGDEFHEAFAGPIISVKVNPKPNPSFFEAYLLYFLIGGGVAAAIIWFFLFRRLGGKRQSVERRIVRPRLIRR